MRGTQSFVHVMAEVFRRPSLPGLEVLWRWVFWGVVLVWPLRRIAATVTEPLLRARSLGLGAEAGGLSPRFLLSHVPGGLGGVVAAVVLWVALSAVGRGWVFRRLEPRWRPGIGSLTILGVLRWAAWAAAAALWLLVLSVAMKALVWAPMEHGGEPQWVGFCGLEIFGTLLLFVGWLATSWVFLLASVYAARGKSALASLRSAWSSGALRGKVAEINLVMGIVKIALIVLAMVFSACPLPFQSVETQGFLVTWTAGVLLLYLLASDYFHLVRLVAFVRMTEVFDPLPTVAAAPDNEAAS